jgi:phage FluMu protein Com
MYISQNKRCKICNKEYSTVSKHGGLYIDHCHATGEVRGLLCSSCNNLLGQCKDDINILKNAIKYLQIFTIFGA